MMMMKGMKRSKLMKMLTSPMRIVTKAADLYKKTMDNYTPAVSHVKLPRSFSSNNHCAGTRNKYYDVCEEPEGERSVRGGRPRSELEALNRMGRSYSVGLGRIGRIDEDLPCEFEEDDEELDYGFGDVKDRVLFRRSSGYGVSRRRRSSGNVGRVGFY